MTSTDTKACSIKSKPTRLPSLGRCNTAKPKRNSKLSDLAFIIIMEPFFCRAGWFSLLARYSTIYFKICAQALSALTCRPRCTWAAWAPSCGAAAGTGPDRCSAGTGPASAWTPGHNTGSQLVVWATASAERGGKKRGWESKLWPLAELTLRKQTYCWCHRGNFQGNRRRVETPENKNNIFWSMGSGDCRGVMGAIS